MPQNSRSEAQQIPTGQGHALVSRLHDDSTPRIGGVAQWPAPALPGEDPACRAAISARLYGEAAPRGIVEEALVNDAIDAMCEVEVWSRHRAALLIAHRHDGIAAVLAPFYGQTELAALVGDWQRGQAQALKVVAGHLAELDPDGALVDMYTMRQHRDGFDWIHKHLTRARNARVIAFDKLESRRLVHADLRRRLFMIDADAVALLPHTPRTPIPVPDDDDDGSDLDLPRPEAVAPAPQRSGPSDDTDATAAAAPPPAQAGDGPAVPDRPDAKAVQGGAAGADPVGCGPAQPRTPRPVDAPGHSDRQDTPALQPRHAPRPRSGKAPRTLRGGRAMK